FNFISGALMAAFAVWLWTGALAATQTTKGEYDNAKARAEATYETERERCDTLAGNAKDVCIAEAQAQRMRSQAAATVAYQNTHGAQYDQQAKNADADRLVARAKCDALTGNENEVCITEANAARTKALADAKAQLKAAEAQDEARKETN